MPLLHARLIAAIWGFRAVRAARSQVRIRSLDEIVLPPVPDVALSAKGGVWVAVRFGTRNCLVRTLVRQAWYLHLERPRAIVIGVRGRGDAFRAHAWLDGDAGKDGFLELARRHP